MHIQKTFHNFFLRNSNVSKLKNKSASVFLTINFTFLNILKELGDFIFIVSRLFEELSFALKKMQICEL